MPLSARWAFRTLLLWLSGASLALAKFPVVGIPLWFLWMRFGVPQCKNQRVCTLSSLYRLSRAVGISLSSWLFYSAMG